MDIGNTVRLVAPVIQGEIKDIEYDKISKGLRMLVEFTEDGEIHRQWFPQAKLEVVE